MKVTPVPEATPEQKVPDPVTEFVSRFGADRLPHLQDAVTTIKVSYRDHALAFWWLHRLIDLKIGGWGRLPSSMGEAMIVLRAAFPEEPDFKVISRRIGGMTIMSPQRLRTRFSLATLNHLLMKAGVSGSSMMAEDIFQGLPELYYERGYDPAPDFSLPWQWRQEVRFLTGYYEAAPWAITPIPNHFLHVSRENPEMVCFTPSEEYGKRDRVTTVKPGRYLTKFYNELHPDRVRELQAQLGKLAVQFAKTPDEIEDIYTSGPESCMSHSADNYESSEHPVRVYGDSDLQLAYIMGSEGKPSARALVWPERLIYGRVYGDSDRLVHRLKALGYKSGNLNGAKIRRVEDGDRSNTIIVPYIDGCCRVGLHKDPKWLTIGGKIEAGHASGIIDLDDVLFTCQGCDEQHEFGAEQEADGDLYCQSCAEDLTTCDNCSRLIPGDGDTYTVHVGDGRTEEWCHRCNDRHTYECDGTNATWSNDVGRHTLVTGEEWSPPYFEEHGICIRGDYYRKDDPDRPLHPDEMPTPSVSLPFAIHPSVWSIYDLHPVVARKVEHEGDVVVAERFSGASRSVVLPRDPSLLKAYHAALEPLETV